MISRLNSTIKDMIRILCNKSNRINNKKNENGDLKWERNHTHAYHVHEGWACREIELLPEAAMHVEDEGSIR